MRLPTFQLHLDAVLIAAAIQGGYWWALARLGPRSVPPGSEVASRRQRAWWTAGVVTILVASTWPVHDLSEGYLFSVHMVQHTLISLVAPPMFLLGCPPWLLRRVLRPRAIRAVASQLTRPFVAFVVFNTVIVATHWPPVVDAMLEHHALHLVGHLVLFTAAACMWWPVVTPLP
jgi:putative membrane protein